MDSRIQYHGRNPDLTAWNPESKTILKVPYIGAEKKRNSLIVDLIWISVPKEVSPGSFFEAPTASHSRAQISL